MGKNHLLFFSFLTEAVILWQYTSSLFATKHTAKKKFIILCGLYSILFAASLFNLKLMNITLYFIFNFVFLVTQYCLNVYSAFFHSSILASVMILCEIMIKWNTIKSRNIFMD